MMCVNGQVEVAAQAIVPTFHIFQIFDDFDRRSGLLVHGFLLFLLPTIGDVGGTVAKAEVVDKNKGPITLMGRSIGRGLP
jgi:hypothetical protein